MATQPDFVDAKAGANEQAVDLLREWCGSARSAAAIAQPREGGSTCARTDEEWQKTAARSRPCFVIDMRRHSAPRVREHRRLRSITVMAGAVLSCLPMHEPPRPTGGNGEHVEARCREIAPGGRAAWPGAVTGPSDIND
jgi:hypothetical protein